VILRINHEGNRESDQRVRDLSASGHDDRAGDDGERDEAVDARVLSVRDHRGAREAATRGEPDVRGQLVADEADQTGRSEHPEMREVLGMDEAPDRLEQRDAG
jgi:hypothetical protein